MLAASSAVDVGARGGDECGVFAELAGAFGGGIRTVCHSWCRWSVSPMLVRHVVFLNEKSTTLWGRPPPCRKEHFEAVLGAHSEGIQSLRVARFPHGAQIL